MTWANASTGAASRSKFGMSGYLATITSASENDFIASKVSAADVWIGAGVVPGGEDCASTNQAGSLGR